MIKFLLFPPLVTCQFNSIQHLLAPAVVVGGLGHEGDTGAEGMLHSLKGFIICGQAFLKSRLFFRAVLGSQQN